MSDALNVRKGITMQEIVSLMRQRREQDALILRQAIDVRDRFNGDVVIPLVDVDSADTLEPPTPNLVAAAVDGNAMRAASALPSIICPWLDVSRARSRKNADTRRRALYAGWFRSQLEIKLHRSYRHLAAYGTCAWMVMPDDTEGEAKMELRDPLTAYPELQAPDDIRLPRNVGFIFGRSIDWITSRYPETKGFFSNAGQRNWDTLWDMVEWIDEDEIVIGILGPRMPAYSPQDSRPFAYNGFEVRRWRNKAGCVPVVIPRRVTLDRIMGQVSTMIGSIDLYSRMTALELVAAEKHVFPDLVIMGEQGQTPSLVGGNWRDGRTGEANLVSGARGVQYLSAQPNPLILQQTESLEGSIRESTGAAGLFGGENPQGLRTGRAISAMGGFSVDPRVQELQLIQARSLALLNVAYLEAQKGYYGCKTFSFYTGLQGDDALVEYTPNKDIDSTENAVAYPIPGADISQTSVALGQMVGSGLMSKHTARVKHPLIDDAVQEEGQLQEEELVSMLTAALGAQVQQGAIDPVNVARIIQLVREGNELPEAVNTAHTEAQKKQAAQPAPPEPGQAAPPGAMPGLAAPPGQGGPPPSIPQPNSSLQNLHQLIGALNANPPAVPAAAGPGS